MRRTLPAMLAVVGAAATSLADQPFFIGLGDLPGGLYLSNAGDVAGAGMNATVIGSGYGATGVQAFRWTQSTGMVALPDLAGGQASNAAMGVSTDGATIIGSGSAAFVEPVRWVGASGPFVIPGFAEGWLGGAARAISRDGLVIAGTFNAGSFSTPCRWTSAGFEALTTDDGLVFGTNADGSVIVGRGGPGSDRA